MVLINLKSTLGSNNNNDEFLYETKTSTKVDDLIESLVEIHNARFRSCLVADAVKALATYGVAKMPENDGTDRVHESIRSGPPPDDCMAEILMREVQSLEEYTDKKQVLKKVSLTLDGIEGKIDSVRGAVTIAYPMGLPEWDPAKIALDDPVETLRGLYLGGGLIDAKDASLWTCNKEFLRGTLVSDRLGSCNEKTKVIAKLTIKGAGPPVRESIVSEAERNAMAAFYFKRQEELKSLAQADEDDYLYSEWADPKGMKKKLQGLDGMKTPSELSRLRF